MLIETYTAENRKFDKQNIKFNNFHFKKGPALIQDGTATYSPDHTSILVSVFAHIDV